MSIKREIHTKLQVGEIPVWVIRKDIKHYHLNVLPAEGRVRVSVPFDVSDELVKMMIIKKMDWIKRHVSNFQNQERQTPRQYISGESHYIRGKRYLMRIEKAKRPKIEIRQKKYIYFSIPENYDIEKRQNYYENYLRKELRSDLKILMPKWEAITGLKSHEVKIKKMKTKWGTCNPEDKRIWINLELIKKPQKYLEYIILHELIHFIEPTHNENFAKLMEKFMPNWRLYRQGLNDFIL